MNSKFLFAVLAIAMLFAGGCISIVRVPENASDSEEIIEDSGDEGIIIDDIGTGDLTGGNSGFEEEAMDTSGLPTKTVVEGALISFPNLKATDPDGDPITYTFSSPLDENGEWQTGKGDAGNYRVTITASDGKTEVPQDVVLIVKPLNNAPVIEFLEDIVIDEGQTATIQPEVSDADGDEVQVTFSGWMTTSSKTAGYEDAGTHTVTVIASDGKDSTTSTVNVVVNNVNRPPVIASIADIEIDEKETVYVSADVSDPDGDIVEVSFSEPLDERGEWTTIGGDAGTYNVVVTATDGMLESEETFRIKVISINKPPVLSGVRDITADEGELIQLSITAEDPEGEFVGLSFSQPFNNNGVWQTGYSDAGVYEVTVTAGDGVTETQESFTVTVNNVNRAPVFGEGAFD